MDGRYCHCGKRAIIRTSWTDLNPGRRFHGCEKSGDHSGCGFFNWYDPPICNRARQVIPGLLRSMTRLEIEVSRLQNQVSRLRAKEKRLWAFLVLSWLFFFC
uniref:GRF-type domain-containing protein n=1 Tax=Davidia involucrata TaxID=16924 RepID=A0A5B7ACY3_DAVIN